MRVSKTHFEQIPVETVKKIAKELPRYGLGSERGKSMRVSKTHFEQIPVETVKKIAKELPRNDAIENDDLTTETQDQITPHPERWREIAQKVQVEKDPQRMVELVADLITAFDEEGLLKSGKTPSVGDQSNILGIKTSGRA
jgi:hypothetical protein